MQKTDIQYNRCNMCNRAYNTFIPIVFVHFEEKQFFNFEFFRREYRYNIQCVHFITKEIKPITK